MRSRAIFAAVTTGVVLIAGCGGSSGSSSTAVNPNGAEVSPAGDIPDNQVFVPYSPPGAGYTVQVPEGWARTQAGPATTFTDKLNSVTMESTKGSVPLTVEQAKSQVVKQLQGSVKGFSSPQVSTVQRKAGQGILITYLAQGKPDPVTGKSVLDAVERYTFTGAGEQVTLTLSGPKGADNVDPFRIITDSLKLG